MSIIDIAKRSIITIKINQIKSYHSLSERWKWLIGLHINKSSDVPHLTRVLLKKTKQRIGYESRWLDPQNEPTPQKNPKDDPSFWEENSPFSRRLRQGPSHWGVLTRPQDPAVHSRARARNRCRPIYWLANAATCTKIIYGDLDEKGMDGLTKWGSHLRDEFNMWLLYVYIYIHYIQYTFNFDFGMTNNLQKMVMLFTFYFDDPKWYETTNKNQYLWFCHDLSKWHLLDVKLPTNQRWKRSILQTNNRKFQRIPSHEIL